MGTRAVMFFLLGVGIITVLMVLPYVSMLLDAANTLPR